MVDPGQKKNKTQLISKCTHQRTCKFKIEVVEVNWCMLKGVLKKRNKCLRWWFGSCPNTASNQWIMVRWTVQGPLSETIVILRKNYLIKLTQIPAKHDMTWHRHVCKIDDFPAIFPVWLDNRWVFKVIWQLYRQLWKWMLLLGHHTMLLAGVCRWAWEAIRNDTSCKQCPWAVKCKDPWSISVLNATLLKLIPSLVF